MLKINGIYKTFNKGTINEKHALNGVNLTLNEGDFVTIIGGNGAGKSTLLNSICGVFPVDCGSIMIDNVDVTRFPEHKRAKYLGRVFQDPMMGTAADMQIIENMSLAYRRGKKRGLKFAINKKEKEMYIQMLSHLGLGLENRLTSKVGLLSGGQRQALTLLMAVMQRPKLLLLDEHTAALDPKTAHTVLSLSDKFIEEGSLTAMMITHNMSQALVTGTRTIMMDSGEIIIDLDSITRKEMNVSDLLKLYREREMKEFDNDRMLLQKD